MNLTNIPTLVAVPFSTSGSKNAVPVISSGVPGSASYTGGFPPETFLPIASGGIPPDGKDVNGVYYDLSYANRWAQAGGRYYYDSTFSTAISGYPKGAIVNRSDSTGQWLNQSDGNTTDPDSAGSANWVAIRANQLVTSISIVAGANTPTKEKLGAQLIIVTGSIASAATLVLPLTAGATWQVRNNTTGAGSFTVVGATGTGVTVPQGVGYNCYTDGTNFYATGADVSGLYLPIGGTAVAATKLAASRNFSISGQATAAATGFDGTGNVVLNVTALAPTGAEINTGLGYTAANDALVAHLAGTETITGSKTFSLSTTFTAGIQSNAGITATGTISSGTTTGYLSVGGLTPGNTATFFKFDGTMASATSGAPGTFYTIWNSGNFTPSNYLPLTGGTCTGAVTATQLKTNGSGVNPSSAATSLQMQMNGSFGGGWNMTDGTANIAAWSTSGTLNIGFGTSGGALTSKMTLDTSGNFVAGGTVRGGSDIRVKRDPQPITGALATVRRALVGVTYHRIDQDDKFEAGFIANAVQEHLPHLVGESDLNGYKDFKTLDYMHTTAYLAAAVTELEDRLIRQQRWIVGLGVALVGLAAILLGH